MRKLVFSLFIVLFGFGFMACEQEEVQPLVQEPQEQFTGDGDDDEDGGVKKGN